MRQQIANTLSSCSCTQSSASKVHTHFSYQSVYQLMETVLDPWCSLNRNSTETWPFTGPVSMKHLVLNSCTNVICWFICAIYASLTFSYAICSEAKSPSHPPTIHQHSQQLSHHITILIWTYSYILTISHKQLYSRTVQWHTDMQLMLSRTFCFWESNESTGGHCRLQIMVPEPSLSQRNSIRHC